MTDEQGAFEFRRVGPPVLIGVSCKSVPAEN
jgi:hypothetical protein